MRRTVVRTGVAGIITVVALGACGVGSDQESAVNLVVSAADEAFIAGSARIVGHETVRAKGETARLPLDGVTDFQTGATSLKIDVAAMGLGGRGTVEARVVDHVMYLSVGDLLQGRRAPSSVRDKRWVKLDLTKFGTSSTDNSANLLQSLRGAGHVRRVGDEKIRGVETTHYRAMVDARAAVRKITDRRLRALAKKGLALLGDSYPVNVWIDGDGRPRRMAVKFSSRGVSVDETVDYVDFGVGVFVVAPPKSETIDIADVNSDSRLGSASDSASGITN